MTIQKWLSNCPFSILFVALRNNKSRLCIHSLLATSVPWAFWQYFCVSLVIIWISLSGCVGLDVIFKSFGTLALQNIIKGRCTENLRNTNHAQFQCLNLKQYICKINDIFVKMLYNVTKGLCMYDYNTFLVHIY
jgi:hypothetical protein